MALEKATLTNTITGDRIPVQFNPEDYTLAADVNYAQAAVPGLSSPILQFVNGGARTLELPGTGPAPPGGEGTARLPRGGDPGALGIGLQAMIAVRLKQHSRKLADSFGEHVRTRPEVVAFWHVAGENDYLVQIAVRDVEHLRNFALDALTVRDEVAHIETSLIFEHRRAWTMPIYPE